MNIFKSLYCRLFQFSFKMIIPILPYREPEVIENMENVANLLSSKNIKNVILVTDNGIYSLGLTKNLEDILSAANISVSLYKDTVSNPTIQNVEAVKDIYLNDGCQAIIAFGGGSSIDCAKAAGARIVKPNKIINKMNGILKIRRKIPLLITVPTTAGTGSETTMVAVITDCKTHNKYPIIDFSLIPHYAVLDYNVTIKLPKSITSTTGMDALTHAVEAYIGNSTTKNTRNLSIESVSLIHQYLKRAYDDGNDIEARKKMLHASYCSGLAFTKSYVGYVHSIAHSLGGMYNVQHGLANAVLLPYFLDEYGTSCYKKLAKLAKATGIADKDDSIASASQKFINWVKEMNHSMNIPTSIKEIKIEDIPTMAKFADQEANPLYPVPKLMNAKQLELMYYKVMDKSEIDLDQVLTKQKVFYSRGITRDVNCRITMLKKLHKTIYKMEDEINEALKLDLGKSVFESYMCEIGMTLSEISYMIKHTKKFSKSKTVSTPFTQFSAHSYIKKSPYGSVLIMSPWNYPFMLTINPLVDAISAGNTAILKPSGYSPNTSKVIKKMIESIFPQDYVTVVTGGREENKQLLDKEFDYIFFTGGNNIAKLVMHKAAENLTPITLELGGKSPCIIDVTANIRLAAKRLVFGKYLNCGQTCVAPDYVYCDEKIKNTLICEIKNQIINQYGKKPLENKDYGKIINKKHFTRINGLIDKNKVIFGGKSDQNTLRIEPTIMDNVTFDDAVMQEEIFGPVMPILTYSTIDEAVKKVNSMPHPLALYIFSTNKKNISYVTNMCQFGGGCVNDTIIHLATSNMGFGGVGASGMGSYHGKKGFDTFTHDKSIVDKKNWIDLPMRYFPYKKIYEKMLRKFLK